MQHYIRKNTDRSDLSVFRYIIDEIEFTFFYHFTLPLQEAFNMNRIDVITQC